MPERCRVEFINSRHTGTVIGTSDNNKGLFIVEMDPPFPQGHFCGGQVPSGRGVYAHPSEMEVLTGVLPHIPDGPNTPSDFANLQAQVRQLIVQNRYSAAIEVIEGADKMHRNPLMRAALQTAQWVGYKNAMSQIMEG